MAGPVTAGSRHPHLAECADHACQAEDEEFLGAMGDENGAYHDTQNRQGRVQALGQNRRGRGVGHKSSLRRDVG